MPNSLFVFAEIKPKPEYFDDAQRAIMGILTATRAEPGCRAFHLYQQPARDGLYLFEEWEDQAALDAHHAQPYTRAVFASYADWLAEPPRILPLNRVA